jgi:aspartyl aminopeptidase
VGRRAGVPVQEFAVRNDMPCGSTIGPILAHNLGCRTVDVGMPQLSMHSIREMAGVDDVILAYRHFRGFFRCVVCVAGRVAGTRHVEGCEKGSMWLPQPAHAHAPTFNRVPCFAPRAAGHSHFSELDASLDVDSLPPAQIQGTIREPACNHVH